MNTIITIIILGVILFILFRVFKVVIQLVIVALFFVVAYFTNPSREAHVAAIEGEAKEIKYNVKRESITVKDYKVISTSHLMVDDDEKWIAIGAFTIVWVFGSLD